MPEAIPEKYRDLFQKRAFASLGTLMPDGRPQVTPVWCDFDGEHVIFNSAKGRQKDRNVRRDPRVSLAVIDLRILTAISSFAAASSRLPKTAPALTSTRWPRNISASTNIPTASPAKCACSTRSSLSTPR